LGYNRKNCQYLVFLCALTPWITKVTPCSLTYISCTHFYPEYGGSTFFQTFASTCQIAQCHNPHDHIMIQIGSPINKMWSSVSNRSKIYNFWCCLVCKINGIRKKWNKTLSTELLSPLGAVSESSKLGFDRAVRRGMWFSVSLTIVWPSSSISSPRHRRFGWDRANIRARCSLWQKKNLNCHGNKLVHI
jgi:hypothetical protein